MGTQLEFCPSIVAKLSNGHLERNAKTKKLVERSYQTTWLRVQLICLNNFVFKLASKKDLCENEDPLFIIMSIRFSAEKDFHIGISTLPNSKRPNKKIIVFWVMKLNNWPLGPTTQYLSDYHPNPLHLFWKANTGGIKHILLLLLIFD